MSSVESRFLQSMENREQYCGKWIAILGSKVVAQGTDIAEVYKDAMEITQGETPLFVEIPEKNKKQTLIL